MRTVFGFLALGLAVSIGAAQAAPELGIRDGAIVLKNKGKTKAIPEGDLSVQAVTAADDAEDEAPKLRYLPINAETGKAFGIKSGVYLFDETGKQAGFVPYEGADEVGQVRQSPQGHVLAIDGGTWVERSWSFFSYPDIKSLALVTYYQAEEPVPALLWDSDGGAFFNSVRTDDQSRTCDYDLCGPKSVKHISFLDGAETTLIAGTDLCDYELAPPSAGQMYIGVRKLCLPSIDAWKTYPEDASRRVIKVRPPAAG